jgi:hypothetical protein
LHSPISKWNNRHNKTRFKSHNKFSWSIYSQTLTQHRDNSLALSPSTKFRSQNQLQSLTKSSELAMWRRWRDGKCTPSGELLIAPCRLTCPEIWYRFVKARRPVAASERANTREVAGLGEWWL